VEHPIEVSYLRWIILIPLIGAAINGLLGARIQKQFGRGPIVAIACVPVTLSFLLAVTAFFQLLGLEPDKRFLLDDMSRWIHVDSLRVNLAFWADPLSAVMLLVVTGIGGLIHFYSSGYLDEEPSLWRFYAYLNLFMAAMLTLVLGDSLLTMFVGWEGVGLCSYALIGFWYKEWANASAGSKAFIVNRIGDFGFVLGMFALFWTLDAVGEGTFVFREIQSQAHLLQGQTVFGMAAATFITLMLFIGATGKSAQIPLYVWLPDAMAGPTPVSALIHAATMVTAGVYMIGRLSFLFAMAPETLAVIATVGCATAFMAATIGVAQNDIKKVLAYSTVSQLGFMFLAMGVGAFSAGIFHLFTHAFFKACLFLGSGSIIHALHHEQDMRNMGGLKKYMPVTFLTFFVSTLAIAGIPFFAGFFSKDEILWKAYSSPHGSPAFWLVGSITAGITAFYMFRQVFMVFYGEYRGGHAGHGHGDDAHGHGAHAAGHGAHGGHGHAVKPHESPPIITVPLLVLALGAVLVGFLNVPGALPAPLIGHHLFDSWLEPVIQPGGHVATAPAGHGPVGEVVAETEHFAEHVAHDPMEYILMGTSVAIALAGIGLAWLVYRRRALSPDRFADALGGVPYLLVYNKYYVDEIYEATVVRGVMAVSRLLAAFDRVVIDGIVNGAAVVVRGASALEGWIDKNIVDGSVNLIGAICLWFGNRARALQTGHIYSYLYAIVVGVVVILFVRLV
jgi:NADH-quinone oxidoreductase subunit L